jgi:hypothetical protein
MRAKLCTQCRANTDRNPAAPLVLTQAEAKMLCRIWELPSEKGDVFCGRGCLLWWINDQVQSLFLERNREMLERAQMRRDAMMN